MTYQERGKWIDARVARLECADLQAASLDVADSAIRKLTARAYDAATDAAQRGAVKVACRAMREMPAAPFADAIRYNAQRNAARGGK